MLAGSYSHDYILCNHSSIEIQKNPHIFTFTTKIKINRRFEYSNQQSPTQYVESITRISTPSLPIKNNKQEHRTI